MTGIHHETPRAEHTMFHAHARQPYSSYLFGIDNPHTRRYLYTGGSVVESMNKLSSSHGDPELRTDAGQGRKVLGVTLLPLTSWGKAQFQT